MDVCGAFILENSMPANFRLFTQVATHRRAKPKRDAKCEYAKEEMPLRNRIQGRPSLRGNPLRLPPAVRRLGLVRLWLASQSLLRSLIRRAAQRSLRFETPAVAVEDAPPASTAAALRIECQQRYWQPLDPFQASDRMRGLFQEGRPQACSTHQLLLVFPCVVHANLLVGSLQTNQ